MQFQLLVRQRLIARLPAAFENVSRFKRITLPLIALMLQAVMPICAQQGGETNGVGTISANTELVLVPVQVRDSAGKSLPGLHKNDFVLRSDGKVQPIKLFEESGRPSVGSNAAAKPVTTVSEEFSNVPEGGMPQHLLIIAVDWVNSPYVEQGWAQQELLKYFSNGPPEQPFALVAITQSGLVQIHSFSSDPKELLQAIRDAHGKLGKTDKKGKTYDELREKATELMRNAEAHYEESMEMKAGNATLLSFVQLEQAYGGIPGRKSLIWLSDKMPDVPAIAAILNRGNIALYPVNIGGVQADAHYSAADVVPPPATQDDDGARDLAAKTGGSYCNATSDLKTCVARAVDDSTNYYLLGFYVPQPDRKPGWHKLQVGLTSGREKVYSRSGYYLEPRTVSSQDDMRSDLVAAAKAQIAYTGIAFSVQRLTESIGLPTAPIGFRIRVPASSVLLQSGQRNLSYELAMVALSDKGEPMAALQTTDLNLNEEQSGYALMKGWRYDETLPKSGSVAAVKFIVRDNGTGNIGSVVVPLTKGRNN